ncbi:MAG: vWA domain-containing protein [Luteolibacter sp.]
MSDPALPETAEALPDTERLISGSMLRLRSRQPFLAALALFAKYKVTREVPTAATDGLTIYINPDFWQPLTLAEQDGLLLHEVLHAALGHCLRRGERDPQIWNIAADIVINGIILAQPGAALPKGGMRDDRLAEFSSEEVYEMLQRDLSKLPPLGLADLLEAAPGSGEGEEGQTSRSAMQRVAIEGHWRHALQRAETLARTIGQGNLPGGLRRELDAIEPGRLDWRAWLWRYLVQTPTDFSGFDRRFIGQGLYLETLHGESIRVHVCVDTSGSVNNDLMAQLLGEVRGILSAYPHILCDLYYADAALHGPHRLSTHDPIPPPEGGGGTDFRPFFNHLAEHADPGETALAVYLTDGYGPFPEQVPELPVLWVVTAGGLAPERFPFGETVRMLV